MIDYLVSWLDTVADVFDSIYGFFKQIIQGFVDLVGYLPQVVSMLTSAIGWLPSTVAAFATLTITVSIIMLIAGRGNN